MANAGRRKGRGQRTICGKTECLIGVRVVVVRLREVVDAGIGRAQIHNQILREDARVSEGILIRLICRRTGVVPIISGRDDRRITRIRIRARAYGRRDLAGYFVVVETKEDVVVLIDGMVDATVNGGAELRFVRAVK